jgi:hypothetical protein
MALVGYTTQKAKIEAAIAEIRATLGSQATELSKGVTGASPASPAGTRRAMSASARRRIAAAQKKRWADYHREHGQPVKAKRKLSAAGRKAIADAARRRWEALRKAKSAATSNA